MICAHYTSLTVINFNDITKTFKRHTIKIMFHHEQTDNTLKLSWLFADLNRWFTQSLPVEEKKNPIESKMITFIECCTHDFSERNIPFRIHTLMCVANYFRNEWNFEMILGRFVSPVKIVNWYPYARPRTASLFRSTKLQWAHKLYI